MIRGPLYEDAIRVVRMSIIVTLMLFDCLVPYARFVLYGPHFRFMILYSIYITVRQEGAL